MGENWPGFVAEILGCENRGYGTVEPGIEVSVVSKAANHPIERISSQNNGNVYLVAPLLDKKATLLLNGKVNDITEPICMVTYCGKE